MDALQKPSLVLRCALSVGYVIFILVNVAAGQGWLGPNNANLSKKNPTPITPASWAFSIWGLIFLLQGAGVIYANLDVGYTLEAKVLLVEAVGYWWLAGWACEALWQIVFQLQSRLGMWLCMLALLGAFGCFAAAMNNCERLQNGGSGWAWTLYSLPTSINTAWLSVASCIGILMVTSQEGLPYPKQGAVLLAAAVTGIGVFLATQQRDRAYGLVLVWSFVAVFVKQERWPVGIASALCAIICLISVAVTFRRKIDPRNMEYSEL